jgi:hypothetical protein
MPMLFWLPAVILSEMWSIAWAEMPTLIPRPIRFPKIIALTGALVLSGATLAQPGVDTQSKANPSGSVMQPQGMTGPINTKSGGAPASSPQGETPAGMQAAPKGSSETIRTDKHGIVEGTPKN